jgi:hypothetical protein
MPIDIQIKGRQLADAAVDASKLDLTDDYTFTGAVKVPTPTATDDAATKAYVDSQLPDTFSGGDGIDIDTSGDPDVISVDLATNPGLQFTSNKLDLKIAENSLVKDSAGVKVKLKAESGGTISVDTDGIYLADGAVANAKLANSTISGKALGANLDNLSAGNGLTGTAYNGSGAQSFAVQADAADGTIAVGAGGVSVADSSITAAKVAFSTQIDPFSGNGSTTSFDLSEPVANEFAVILVHVNGLLIEQLQSGATTKDEFVLNPTGGAGGVGQITFGAAPDSGDVIRVFYIA